VIHDEAHQELWADDTQTGRLAVAEPGLCLVTWQPDALPDAVRRSIDVTLTLAEAPGGLRATLQFAGEPARTFHAGERRSAHVRHQHKYATTPLPEHRRFHFHGATGSAAATLDEFRRHLRHCDLATLDHHLTHGDFSRWVLGTLADCDLGADLAAIERDLRLHRASELEHARRRTIDSIERRYLTRPDR